MKYIIIGFEGFIFSLAYKLQKEGQEVILAQIANLKDVRTSNEPFEKESPLDKKQRLSLYNKIINKIDADVFLKKAKKIKNPSDYFVICESNYVFKYAQKLQAMGFEGIFPTEEDREYELDRNKAKEFVKKHYPNISESLIEKFNSVDKAIAFLNKSKEVWVLKSQTDSVATFVPPINDPLQARKQLIDNLYKNQHEYEKFGFILEKKIEDVVEITPEKIYYDGQPLGMTVMFENKFIGSGNLSYQVGCAGDVVFPISMDSKIHDLSFPPIVDEIAKKHKGLFIWDASLLIDRKTNKVYFGEFCPNRFGFNSFYTTLEQMPNLSYYFESVVNKKNPYKLGSVGVSITLFNLIQDLKAGNYQSNISINFPDKYTEHIWFYELALKKDNYYNVGYDTVIAPVTASGVSIPDAVNKLYSYVDSISINNIYYRPKFDYLSTDYPTSILNRIKYCLDNKLFTLPFKKDF